MARTTFKSIPTNPVERPALTPEGRENQMIALATNLAEQQMRDGTASSQIITHYLKLGSVKSELELEKLRRENELLRVKAEAVEAAKHSEEMYQKALDALRSYSGGDGL